MYERSEHLTTKVAISEIVFFCDTYVNLLVLLVENDLFCEIPFSKENSLF